MTTTLAAPYAPLPNPRRRLFSRTDCEEIEKTGVLSLPYELIEGEIIEAMPYHRPHAYTLMELTIRMIQLFGAEFVQSQMPMEIMGEDAVHNFPIPDLVLLKQSFRTLPYTHPQASDMKLLVEVSDSALASDLTTKARLFARAGVPLYWIIDVNERRLFALSEPEEGEYTRREEIAETGIILIEGGSESLSIASLFPPKP